MASNVRGFIGSYLIRDGEKTVGCTVKSNVVDGVRNGRIIGFNLNPSVDEYFKIVQLSGDSSLDGMIIPDTSLLVKIDDFFKGQFVGIEIRKEVRLRKQYTVNRNGKTVQIFSMERMHYERVNYDKLDLDSLKTFVGGDTWEPVTRTRLNKDKINEKTGDAKVIRTDTSVHKGKKGEEKKKKIASVFKEPEEIKMYEKLNSAGSTIIIEKIGNLFSIESGLIVNCISADVHMGAGIAKDFDRKFRLDKETLKMKKTKVGVAYIINDDTAVSRGYLVTKDTYDSKPTEDTMRSCLKSLFRQCERARIREVFMPKIGCGLDKMKWEDVRQWIEEYIDGKDLKVVIFHLDTALGTHDEERSSNACRASSPESVNESVRSRDEDVERTIQSIEELYGVESISMDDWKTSDKLLYTNKLKFDLSLTNLIEPFIDPELVNILGYKEVDKLEEIICTPFTCKLSCVLEVETDDSYLIVMEDEMKFNFKAIATAFGGAKHEVGLSLVG